MEITWTRFAWSNEKVKRQPVHSPAARNFTALTTRTKAPRTGKKIEQDDPCDSEHHQRHQTPTNEASRQIRFQSSGSKADAPFLGQGSEVACSCDSRKISSGHGRNSISDKRRITATSVLEI